jgi:hypothetical protein
MLCGLKAHYCEVFEQYSEAFRHTTLRPEDIVM